MNYYRLMRFTGFIIGIAAALTMWGAQPPATGGMSAVRALKFDKYAQANDSLPAPGKDEKRIVFFGSSITEGWMAEHPEFFEKHGYIARGISGQSTYALLLRFRADAIDLEPACIVLGVGEPDIAAGDDDYDENRTFANIETMCELARLHGIQIVLTSVLPAENYYWNQKATDVPDKIESLNNRIRDYAQLHRIPYADYYTPLVHPGDRALPVTFSDDGVHPNGFGYTIMEPVIQAILKKLPSRPSASKKGE